MTRLVGLVLLALASCALSVPAAEIVVEDTDWRPWTFGGAEDHPPGFAKEVLDRCLRSVGHKPRYLDYPVVRLYEALENGDLDLHVMSRQPERERYVVYGEEPLFTARYRPIVRVDEPVRIRELGDLDSLRLGHVRGLRYSDEYLEYLEARLAAGTADETVSNESILRMLVAGRIDAFVNQAATSRWFAHQLGLADRIRIEEFDIRTSDYFLVVSRRTTAVDDPAALVAELDECIAALKLAPAWGELRRKYAIESVVPGPED